MVPYAFQWVHDSSFKGGEPSMLTCSIKLIAYTTCIWCLHWNIIFFEMRQQNYVLQLTPITK